MLEDTKALTFFSVDQTNSQMQPFAFLQNINESCFESLVVDGGNLIFLEFMLVSTRREI